MAFLLKAYSVAVSGFAPISYDAPSPGKARSKAWHAYRNYRDVPFKEILRISIVSRVDPPPGFGERITVGGRPAYRCLASYGQYTRFVRDDSDVVLLSHPADVEPFREAA